MDLYYVDIFVEVIANEDFLISRMQRITTSPSFYTAKDAAAIIQIAAGIRQKFIQVEAVLGDGPYFSGQNLCMVDAVFGLIFRYFDVFDEIGDFSIFDDLIKVQAWRVALSQRPSVRTAVAEDYPARLRSFLCEKNSEFGELARSSALV